MTRSMTCHCGLELGAEDTGSLIAPLKTHFDEAHPELGLTVNHVRNYLESEDRSTGPIEHLETIGEIEIRPISPESAADVGGFFDIDATPDNPAWGACYCMFFFRGGHASDNWGQEPWQENRRDQLARISAGSTTGTLAYVDGKLAGWCNTTARAEFPGLSDGDDEGIASVVCFVIAPPFRRHGLATLLLESAISRFTEQGFRRLEAYPARDPADQRAAFHGTLDLYGKFGFQITSEEPLIVALELA